MHHFTRVDFKVLWTLLTISANDTIFHFTFYTKENGFAYTDTHDYV